MGNAQVIDTKTGNMIGLNDGFVPVGIKEHGGVIYIASYNPETQEGELGSIPSPKVSYELRNSNTETINTCITGVNDEDIIIDNKVLQQYLQLDDDTLFRVGDQFMVELDLSAISKLANSAENLISYMKEEDKIQPGMYTISLYSKTLLGTYIKIDTSKHRQYFYYKNDSEIQYSDYWFVQHDPNKEIDIEKTYKDKTLLITYPNIPSGYLYIKVSVEKPKNPLFIINESINVNCPIYYIL